MWINLISVGGEKIKINIDVEIPEDVKKLFLESGVKEEAFDSFMKDLLINGVNQMLTNLPEILLALKTQAIPTSDIAKALYEPGLELGQKLKEKYPKEKPRS